MGKTIGRIALVAAAIAVNVIPGAGQAISATLVSVGLSTAAATALTTLAITTITAAGIQAGAALAGLGPKAPKPQTTTGTRKEPIPPRVYLYGRRRLYGALTFWDTASDGTTVDVYAFLDGQADGYEQVYLNDDKVTLSGDTVQPLADKTYQKGRVKAYFTLGQATNTAFAVVIAKLGGIWTSAHRGDGVVTGALLKAPEKDKDYLTTYPQGDSVQLSAVFRGQLCFDPRDGGTRYTENPVLQLLHYITVRRGYDYNTRIAPTVQYWINAANICDEQVALRDGGSEARYRSCISYESTATPKEVLGSFLECFDGWIAPRGDGALVVYAGKLYEPTVTIGPDDILSYKLQNYIEAENVVDQLKVTYISEAHDWSEVDATPWGAIAGRRSEAFTPQTPSYSQNRRLAKRVLARNNAPRRGSVTTTLAGRKVRGHRYVRLDLREAGYDPFDGMPPVVEVQTLQRDFEGGGITFEWVLVDENIDDWNPATEQGYPAQLGDSVPVVPAPAPTLTSATVQFSSTGGTDGDAVGGNVQGVSGARILLNGTGPARDDLTWYARWRLGTDGAWSERDYTDIDPSANVQILTEYVPSAQNVQTQISYSNGNGVLSDWSNTLTVDTRMPD